jgi:hypothetical protein
LIFRSAARDWLNPHTTFKTDLRADLTSWNVCEPHGSIHRVGLKPFDRYPVFMTGSGRITRVRVVKTRITYVKDGVSFTRTWKVDDSYVEVEVSVPQVETAGANVAITLTAAQLTMRDAELRPSLTASGFTCDYLSMPALHSCWPIELSESPPHRFLI